LSNARFVQRKPSSAPSTPATHIVNQADAELHPHQGQTVRAHAEESLMAEREDAGIAVDQIPTRSERSEEEGEDEDVEQVRLARQRRNSQKKCGGKPGEADAGGA
jgi:hypothetical protein